jgi:hypothetical protein
MLYQSFKLSLSGHLILDIRIDLLLILSDYSDRAWSRHELATP